LKQGLKSYFILARSKEHLHQHILRDLKFFLKYLEISDPILALEDEYNLSAGQISKIDTFFSSYLLGMPLDYILRESIFYGYKFYVDSRVLIPRPETELIVDWVLDLSLKKSSIILEVGTGSGCIAISIGLKNRDLKILATEISNSAIEVALINREIHNARNVTILQSNWLSCAKENSLDVVISNPPYLMPNDVHLEDLQHEPMIALISQNGSQSFYDIALQAMFSLKPGGKIIFEHGCYQAKEVSNILKYYGFNNVVSKQDFQGLDRYTYANK
jgi:release factor glutamine methyltransferase